MDHIPEPVMHTLNSVSAGVMAILAPITGAVAAVGCTTAVIIAAVLALVMACLCCCTSPIWLFYALAQAGSVHP